MQHTLLPPLAQEILRAAAQTPNTPSDPRARDKAIDAAIQQVKRYFPRLFRDA